MRIERKITEKDLEDLLNRVETEYEVDMKTLKLKKIQKQQINV